MHEDVPIGEAAGERLTERGETLATAESCSGGLIAHRITNIAGSSRYFQGGVITYSNEAKMALLGVRRETLEAVGAVSEAVAVEMAEGARSRLRADWGIGVTGIAGPGGGTAEKPVGLVYIAVAGPDGATATRNEFLGDRIAVKEQTANRALQLLMEAIG